MKAALPKTGKALEAALPKTGEALKAALPKTGETLKAAPPKVGYAIVYMQISTILFYVECTQVFLSFDSHSAENP